MRLPTNEVPGQPEEGRDAAQDFHTNDNIFLVGCRSSRLRHTISGLML